MDEQTFNLVLAVAAVVITLSFIVQATTFLVINSRIKKLNNVATSMQTKVDPLMTQAQETFSNVKGSVDKISAQATQVFDQIALETRAVSSAISTSSREIAHIARTQAEQLSQTLDQSNLVLQRHISDIDQLLTRTQARFEDTTVEVQTTVIKPLRDLAALIVGVRRTVDVLLKRERKPIDQAYQDEEMFI